MVVAVPALEQLALHATSESLVRELAAPRFGRLKRLAMDLALNTEHWIS